jgi:tetratricopeptide (TPR) repeat protein
VSHSPDAAESSSDYALGWTAINRLLRQGWSWSGHERNCAFLNLGRHDAPDAHGFADSSAVSGFAFPDDARAVAATDWDGDGDQDLLITNRTGPRLRLLANECRTPAVAPRSCAILLRGQGANTGAIGARVVATAGQSGARPIVRARRAGEGYLSQSSAWIHMPLPDGARSTSITVRWPGGRAEEFTGLAPGGRWILVEGSARARAWTGTRPSSTAALRASSPTPPAPSSTARIVLRAPLPMPTLPLVDPLGERADLFGIAPGGSGRGTGQPLLILLWASWCGPCLDELAALAEASAAGDSGGPMLLALGVEEQGERPAAFARLQELGWKGGLAWAEPMALETLDAIVGSILDRDQRLALPASFVVDAAGRLRALHLGAVAPDDLEHDLALCSTDDAAQLRAATPFFGRWRHAPAGPDLGRFERAFALRGLHEAARQMRLATFDVRSSPARTYLEFGRRAGAGGRWGEAAELFRQAAQAAPESVEAHADLGLALHRLRRFEEAVDAYTLALRLRPLDPDIHFNLGLAFLALGRIEAARAEIEALRSLSADLATELDRLVRKQSGS